TGRPIKFVGTGERIEDLESFHPDRMASRILGMGDIVSLVEKAEQAMERDRAKELEEKFRRASFTFEDFLSQLQAVRRMGPLDQLMGMIPGAGKAAKNMHALATAITPVAPIINTLPPQPRFQPKILNGSRRKRIARGSGTTVQEVNQLVKQFHMMQKMLRQMGRAKGGRLKMRMPLVG
ncbi:MAG: signal recognition particle protein, partial [Gemmatimonadetes bacterium]|nr:signal recognition particle protein [Gemmatimonadota bacterium]